MTLTQEDPPSDADGRLRFLEDHIQELQGYIGEDISESDTRSKIIDPILTHVLGWAEPRIRRETNDQTDGKYLDYRLSTTRPVLVVEAKKQHRAFEFPLGNNRYYRLNGAITKSKELYRAVQQARNYASNTGLSYCCVTNGYQWAIFRPNNSQGIQWNKQFVLVFRTLEDVLEHFSLFYNAISYDAACSGIIAKTIPISSLAGNSNSRFSKFASELNVSFETRNRNILYPYTKDLISSVFQNLDNADASTELLEHCYVESARDSGYERGIGDLLKEHKSQKIDGIQRIKSNKRDAGKFQKVIERHSKTRKGSVSLILGTVGAGKTSFINRFHKVYAKNLIQESFIWIYISFNNFTEAQDTIQTHIANVIKTTLKETFPRENPYSWANLKAVYADEVTELREGFLDPYFQTDQKTYEIKLSEELKQFSKDEHEHHIRCLKFFSEREKKRIMIVYDNADQHSPKLQNELFLIAERNAKRLNCPVFISLREESYWKNRDIGGLSAFHSTAYQISAPRLEQVLAKRFKFAQMVIEGETETTVNTEILEELDISTSDVLALFKKLQQSLLGNDRRFIRFLEYSNPGEVRRALDSVARFLTSGHTNVNRIIDRPSSAPLVSFHEFLQAVMLGDRTHYREDISDTFNLFGADGSGDQSNLNRIAVLARLLSARDEVSEKGKGLIEVSRIVGDCESIGMTQETCLTIISRLIQKRLAASQTLDRECVEMELYIRPTTAAIYYINELALEFSYLDNIIIDTEIGDTQARDTLRNLSRDVLFTDDRTLRLQHRLNRAEIFVNYLLDEYNKSSLSHADDRFDVVAKNLILRIHEKFQSHKKEIMERGERELRMSK